MEYDIRSECFPPHNDRPTSIAAARIVKENYSNNLRKVLAFIYRTGEYGAHNAEIHQSLKILQQSVGSLTNTLWKKDCIRKSGKTRKSEISKHDNEVWVIPKYMSGDEGKHPGYKSVKLELDILNGLESLRVSESESEAQIIRRLVNDRLGCLKAG
jgi:hypothetical protein